MARDLYDDHFKAVESMPRGVVVTLRNIATQLESAWELHTNRQVLTQKHINSNLISQSDNVMHTNRRGWGNCLGTLAQHHSVLFYSEITTIIRLSRFFFDLL